MFSKEIQAVYEQIMQGIVDGVYEAGTPLAEIPLANQYHIKRTRIRQIFQKLETEALVERFPNRGAFVKQITSKDLQEIFEMREALESMAAKLAARRRSDEELQRILAAFETYQESSDKEYFEEKVEIGERLHQFILRSSENGRIIETMQRLKLQVMRIWKVGIRIPDRINNAFKEHLEILSAIKEKNGDLAECRMKEHISTAFKDYINITILNKT